MRNVSAEDLFDTGGAMSGRVVAGVGGDEITAVVSTPAGMALSGATVLAQDKVGNRDKTTTTRSSVLIITTFRRELLRALSSRALPRTPPTLTMLTCLRRRAQIVSPGSKQSLFIRARFNFVPVGRLYYQASGNNVNYMPSWVEIGFNYQLYISGSFICTIAILFLLFPPKTSLI